MRTPAQRTAAPRPHVWRYSPTETYRPWLVSVPGEDGDWLEAREFDTWEEAIKYANNPD